MKLILVVVQADDANNVIQALNEAGCRATRMASEGGWLKRENVTLMIGVEDYLVDRAIDAIRGAARGRSTTKIEPKDALEASVKISGAIAFVMGVEQYERI
jgi:uncharacterized protein YaaQ